VKNTVLSRNFLSERYRLHAAMKGSNERNFFNTLA
jgi:hypothetical protein